VSRQLALRVGLPDLASFDNFHPGSNREAVAAIRELACDRPGLSFLHGESGTGKSHLLYAAVKEAAAHDRPALYASRKAVEGGSTDWLDLPGDGLTCIDDIGESLIGDEATALFSLYERVRSRSGSLILSSRVPPAAIHWVLPDLRSRVQSDLVYHLRRFSEGELEQALRLRAGHRGMHLSDEVVRFVLNRYERGPASLFRLLDRIDTESLERKRRITVPFLKALENE
jgi:DnaA family protein